MSVPKKHHYLPEFYTRSWASGDGRVVSFRRPWKEIDVKRHYPSQIGYKTDLYAIPSLTDPALRQVVESKFLSFIDNDAAIALQHLLDVGGKPADARLRDGWSRFLMSLLHRHPRRIEHISNAVQMKWEEMVVELEAEYLRNRTKSDPPTYEEWAARRQLTGADELQARLLTQIMDSKQIGMALNAMEWAVEYIPQPKWGLLTSDFPLLISNGLGLPNSFVILPLCPDKYFIAANNLDAIKQFREQIGPRLELGFNDAVVCNAAELVVGADEGQTRFVDNRLGRTLTLEHEMVPGIPTWKFPTAD